MKPTDLVLRCYAEKVDGHWQAFCLDLCLAAQADTFQEAKDKLKGMICEYVFDALVGEDRQFAVSLLKRRAPLKYWCKFYFYVGLSKIGALRDGMLKLFMQVLPLEPQHLKHA